jgi:2-(1,2-epoxy-1,2-dihydrophenyl)acetyl-CoA isomerase
MSLVQVERQGAVLIVTLNQPDRLNALSGPLLDALGKAWQAGADPAVRAVLVTGQGRGFCAGADLTSQPDPDDDRPAGMRYYYNANVLAMAALDKPVIAAINGVAAGAGIALALGADLRIASTAARFIPAFSAIGVVPDSGASFFITRALGYAAAFDWLSSGEEMGAERAKELGLVQYITDPENLMPLSLERANRLAETPGPILALTKRLLGQAGTATLAQQLEAETVAADTAHHDPDTTRSRLEMAEQFAQRRKASN